MEVRMMIMGPIMAVEIQMMITVMVIPMMITGRAIKSIET